MTIHVSKRLQLIAEKVSSGSFFADIGSDHAYLPTYICLKDERARAIAGEVAKGPYERAKQTVTANNLTHRIHVRIGNGLEVINTEESVEEIIIAGMGGKLISTILEEGKAKLSPVKRLILQPNMNEKQVRQMLINLNFVLVSEQIIQENDHIYEILIAKNNNDGLLKQPYNHKIQDKQLLFGPYLLKEKSEIFIQKWRLEKDKLTKVIAQMKRAKQRDEQKILELERMITWIEEVIANE